MQENCIKAKHKRRFKVTTDSEDNMLIAPNLLERNFAPAAPNEVWTSNITYLWTDEGWLYLAIVLDLFNREVIGWSLQPRMTTDIVTDALTMAWFRRRPEAGVMRSLACTAGAEEVDQGSIPAPQRSVLENPP